MLILVLSLLLLPAQSSAPCTAVDDCRARAEAAAAQGDYETFHDLAWRAVQKGKPNDPALMYLLARAMALSGRPGDAFVMLSRLADMGVPTDAATNDDFRRVRGLKNWPDLEAKLMAGPAPAAAPKAPNAPSAPAPVAPEAPPAPVAPESISFDPTSFTPAGLAYDAVSRRFLIADRAGDRLMVVDEASHHVANLVHAAAAGFRDDLTAFDIDHRRGDLWVVSASGEGDAAVSTVHKLQLISGRSLMDIQATGFGPVRLIDVSVVSDGTVWLLDAAGSRLLRVRPGSRAVELGLKLEAPAVSALAVSDANDAFVATDSGIVHVDLATREVSPVKVRRPLAGVTALRWYRGSLVAVSQDSGHARLVRLKLDGSGTAITGQTPLADDLPSRTSATISGDTLYYLAGPDAIKAIKLKR